MLSDMIDQVATKSGMSPLLVTVCYTSLAMTAVVIGVPRLYRGARRLVGRWRGEHLPVGPEAQAVLDLLARPTGWCLNRPPNGLVYHARVPELHVTMWQSLPIDVVVGTTPVTWLNRREQRLIVVAARAVIARLKTEAEENARRCVRDALNPER